MNQDNRQTQTQLPTAIEQALERTTREQRRTELAEIAFTPGQMFQPANSRELMDMASMISGAGHMIKPLYRGNPGACMGLIAVCAPYGLNPLQVSWKTYKASQGDDAPIAYEAQVIVAMINASGALKGGLRYKYEGDGQNRRCCAYGTLKGEDEPIEVWSPPLKDIKPQNSPLWKSDPDQQLAYYTGRSWVRRTKPEMLLGIYSTDEVDGPAIGPEKARDVTPRRGGVRYEREPEADPQPQAPAQGAGPIDGEIVTDRGEEDGAVVDPGDEDLSPEELERKYG